MKNQIECGHVGCLGMSGNILHFKIEDAMQGKMGDDMELRL